MEFTLPHYTSQHGTVLYIIYCTALHFTVQHLLYSTALYCNTFQCTALYTVHSTVLHFTSLNAASRCTSDAESQKEDFYFLYLRPIFGLGVAAMGAGGVVGTGE